MVLNDGTSYGCKSHEAVSCIIGGGDQPKRITKEAVLARILSTPLPNECIQWPDDDGEAYSLATDIIAHAMHATTTTSSHLDSTCEVAWQRAESRWPNLDAAVQGATGFQVGFAWNTVRWLHNKTQTENPALLELG